MGQLQLCCPQEQPNEQNQPFLDGNQLDPQNNEQNQHNQQPLQFQYENEINQIPQIGLIDQQPIDIQINCSHCNQWKEKIHIYLKQEIKMPQDHNHFPFDLQIYKDQDLQSIQMFANDEQFNTSISSYIQNCLALKFPLFFSYKNWIVGQQMYYSEEQLTVEELQCLIMIKFGIVKYFNNQKPWKNNFIRNIYGLFCNLFHTCQFFRLQISQNITNYLEYITLYTDLYYCYCRYISEIEKSIGFFADIIYKLFDTYYQTTIENKRISIIGYAIRFWCQIVLTENIRKSLLECYRNIEWNKGNSHLCYKYVVACIDVSVTETTIHWLGHSKQFYLNTNLIDLQFNNIKSVATKSQYDNNITFEQFSKEIDELLQFNKLRFPEWFYQIEYEKLGIKMKINFLAKFITKKYQLEQTLKIIKEQQKKLENDDDDDLMNWSWKTGSTLPSLSYILVNQEENQEKAVKSTLIKNASNQQNIQKKYISTNPDESSQKLLLDLQKILNERNIDPQIYETFIKLEVQQYQIFDKIFKRDQLLENRAKYLNINSKINNGQQTFFNSVILRHDMFIKYPKEINLTLVILQIQTMQQSDINY